MACKMCSRALRALRGWWAHVLDVLARFACPRAWRALRACVLGVLYELGVCLRAWRAWRAS